MTVRSRVSFYIFFVYIVINLLLCQFRGKWGWGRGEATEFLFIRIPAKLLAFHTDQTPVINSLNKSDTPTIHSIS